MSPRSLQMRREAATPPVSLAPLAPSFEPETECRHFQTIGYATVKAHKADYQAEAIKNLDSCSTAMNDNIPDPKDTDALATLKARYHLVTTDDIDEQLI